MRIALCIPTLNASSIWSEFTSALSTQTVQPNEVIVVDSSSTDGTAELAEKAGYCVVRIARKDFRHGGSRQLTVSAAGGADVLIFMTQDATLAHPESLSNLLRWFDESDIAAAYGRQLPRKGADAIETFARQYNYPEQSSVRSLESVSHLGFKSIFFSNSFGAYRRSALESVGGFPVNARFGEDTQVAAKILLAGGKIAYAANAEVYHSHPYSFAEEFDRYKEIGRMHSSELWMLKRFGSVSGEGGRFVRSELKYLLAKAPHLIPSAMIRTLLKYYGYKVGRRAPLAATQDPDSLTFQ